MAPCKSTCTCQPRGDSFQGCDRSSSFSSPSATKENWDARHEAEKIPRERISFFRSCAFPWKTRTMEFQRPAKGLQLFPPGNVLEPLLPFSQIFLSLAALLLLAYLDSDAFRDVKIVDNCDLFERSRFHYFSNLYLPMIEEPFQNSKKKCPRD